MQIHQNLGNILQSSLEWQIKPCQSICFFKSSDWLNTIVDQFKEARGIWLAYACVYKREINNRHRQKSNANWNTRRNFCCSAGTFLKKNPIGSVYTEFKDPRYCYVDCASSNLVILKLYSKGRNWERRQGNGGHGLSQTRSLPWYVIFSSECSVVGICWEH